jgi:hypothetical protein
MDFCGMISTRHEYILNDGYELADGRYGSDELEDDFAGYFI